MFGLALGLTQAFPALLGSGGGGVRGIIADLDFTTDIDDAGTMALLPGFCTATNTKLLAVTAAARNPYVAPALKASLEAFGEPFASVPVGAYQGTGLALETSSYDQPLRDRYKPGLTRTDFADAVTLYRTILAAAAPGGVKFYTSGPLTNMAALLQSPGDGISPLTGAQLVAAKVSAIYMVVGDFTTPTINRYNSLLDPTAAAYVSANWPSPMIYGDYVVGLTIATKLVATVGTVYNPLIDAWALGQATWDSNGRRPSWDECVLYYAFYGDTTGLFSQSAPGDIALNTASPFTTYSANASGKSRYITRAVSDAAIATALETQMASCVIGADRAFTYTNYDGSRLAEWNFTEGAGDTIADASGNGFDLTRGVSGSGKPTWVDLGGGKWVMEYATGQGCYTANNVNGLSLPSMTFAVIFKSTNLATTQALITKRTSAVSIFQFRTNGAVVEMVTPGPSTTSQFGSRTVVNTWHALVVMVDGRRIRAYKNGSQINSPSDDKTIGTMMGANPAAMIGVGGSYTSSIVDSLIGQMAYAAILKPGVPIADIQTRLASVAAAKGITLA